MNAMPGWISTQLSDARVDFQQDAAVGGTIGGPLGSSSSNLGNVWSSRCGAAAAAVAVVALRTRRTHSERKQ